MTETEKLLAERDRIAVALLDAVEPFLSPEHDRAVVKAALEDSALEVAIAKRAQQKPMYSLDEED